MLKQYALPFFFTLSCSVVLSPALNAQDLSQTSLLKSEASVPDPLCTPAPKDPSLWDKSLTAGYNYTDGNAKTSSMNINSKIGRDYQNDVWQFEVDYNRGDAAATAVAPDRPPRETTKDNIRGIGNYKRILDDTYYAALGSSVFHDAIADLKYRAIVNPALGAYLLRDDTVKLSLEAGPAYVWDKKGDISENYLAPRIANGFSWKISETARIYQSAEYLTSIDDSKNYIVNAEIGVEAALTSLVNIVFSVRDNYVNDPAAGRERNDIWTITGLKVNL